MVQFMLVLVYSFALGRPHRLLAALNGGLFAYVQACSLLQPHAFLSRSSVSASVAGRYLHGSNHVEEHYRR